ncbi:glycosyltransferase family A protein [uncultured Sphingomonas sp.]|uniref:glycosyltransferase family 2 protein n=1 Tax=uncultured Sphingomonas sp. TaxID=158754 RepID=UPI0025FDAF9F|nr:glycosyltransferase family A protein [uncultured Sphingomonas sp.]
MTTTISVVIPARNRAAVIGRAIACANTQTFRPIEIIVVDDGSDDDGATIAAAQAARSEAVPIRIIPLDKRAGAPNARNIGAAAATGEWIALLDSDDGWDETKLASLVPLMDDDVVAVFSDTVFLDGKGGGTRKFGPETDDPDGLLYENTLGGCSAAMIRRQTFLDIEGFDVALPSCQDWDMWLKLRQAGRIALSHEPLTQYYFDAGDRISRNPQSVVKGHELLYRRILSDYAPADRVGDIRRFQPFHLAQTLAYFTGVRKGTFRAAIRNLIWPHPRTTRRSALHLLATSWILKRA